MISSLCTGRRLRLIIFALVALCSVLLSGNTGLVYALFVATKDMFVVQTPGMRGESPANPTTSPTSRSSACVKVHICKEN